MSNFSAIHMALQNSDDLNRVETSKLYETLANSTLGRGHCGKRVACDRASRSCPFRKFLKLWLLKSFVARQRSGTRAATGFTMKIITVQLPARLTKRILFPRAGPPRAAGFRALPIEGIGRRCLFTFFRSLRAVLSGVLDSSAYNQVSLGREVCVAFTSQGPVIFRYGRNSPVDSVSATRETNRRTNSGVKLPEPKP